MGKSSDVASEDKLTGQLYAQGDMTFFYAIANTTVHFHDVELVSI